MLYGLAANTDSGIVKYGELIGWAKDKGTNVITNVQVAGNNEGAVYTNRRPKLVAVGDVAGVTLSVDLTYWDRDETEWYIDTAGHLDSPAKGTPEFETNDFFKYGRSGWNANNAVEASSDATLRKWTALHSETFHETIDLADLPYPTIAKDGEEPIHRIYFNDVVGNDNLWDDVDRYSDSAKQLILAVNDLKDPQADINNIPWEGCVGNMMHFVPENLTGDIEIPSVVAQYTYNSLSLDTEISVNFYVQIHPDFRDAEEYELTTTHSLTWCNDFELTQKGNLDHGESNVVYIEDDFKSYYQIKLPLNANEMWRTFKVQLTDKGSDSVATYTAKINNVQQSGATCTATSNIGTIKDYARAILQGASTNYEYEDASKLVAAMLNYGNEVRDCFWLGGDDRPWIDELKEYGYPLYEYSSMEDNDFSDKKNPSKDYKSIFTPYKSKGSKKNDALSYVGSSLVFDTNIAIRHYFKLNGAASAEGVEALNAAYEAAVRKSDGTLIMDLEYQYSEDQKMYYVEYRDIAAQDLDEMFLFTFSNGEYDADTNYVVKLNYGVYSYAYVTWNKLTAERFITAALYEYCKQAKDYLSWQGTV